MSEEYLDNILQNVNKKLDEYSFVNIYLPLLFKPSPYEFNLRWINEVATSPHIPVDIVEELTENNEKVLFTVPALRKSFLTDKYINIQQELNRVAVITDANTMLGYSMFIKTLSNFFISSEGIDEESMKQWQTILSRYNLQEHIADVAIKYEEKSNTLFEDEEW